MLNERERRRFTVDEYLSFDEKSLEKSEYSDGDIYSMSGGSLEHNRIVRNWLRHLDAALEGKGCEVFPSDLRMYVKQHKLFTYPDITVVRGTPRLLAGRKDTITDATLIIEVLSPSTESYDRNEKFRSYRSLPSLTEYVLVAQDEVRVEQHLRQRPGRWVMTESTSLDDDIELSSIDVKLRLESIYRGVELAQQKRDPGL